VTLIDLLAHLAYLTIFIGTRMLAYQRIRGWPVRIVGDLAFIPLGFALGLTSTIVWGSVFLTLDVIGWRAWRKAGSFSATELDINELREELFATSRRLGDLRSEYAKRNRARIRKETEEFNAALRKLRCRGMKIDGADS
jgi:nicotinamide mononucleotide transporter